jgi:hypothetical protein
MKKESEGLKSTSNNQSPPATTTRSNKNNNKKQINKDLCPFACPNCQSLGGDLVKSKYEIINILSDIGDSIFSPMHEERCHQNNDDDYHKNHNRSALRNGKVFLSADLLDSFFQQQYKK